MIPTESAAKQARIVANTSFNLVIEKLMIPTVSAGCDNCYAEALFQSRNRETYDSNSISTITTQVYVMFQSRNRETYDSNTTSLFALRSDGSNQFQSRNRETYDSNPKCMILFS